MDNETYTLLKKMNLKNTKLISLKEFEDKQLLSVKGSRTFGEYCWTCTPSLPLYIFKHYPKIKEVTYLDADLYFFQSPDQIFKDFGNNSIFLIPHRHPASYKHLERVHGKFNVGLLIFRNDKNGISCLRYWRKKCLEWCYLRRGYHKYGDQFYLNDFPSLFKGVYVSNNIGYDTAPWNVSGYLVTKKDDQIYIDDTNLTFYHFANVQIYGRDKFRALPKDSLFVMSSKNTDLIYKPYFSELEKSINWVHSYDPDFSDGINQDPDSTKYRLISLFDRAKQAAKKTPLIYLKRIINRQTNT